ncbi:unnamed protein product, partial [Mesorhabditis spiculigera]
MRFARRSEWQEQGSLAGPLRRGRLGQGYHGREAISKFYDMTIAIADKLGASDRRFTGRAATVPGHRPGPLSSYSNQPVVLGTENPEMVSGCQRRVSHDGLRQAWRRRTVQGVTRRPFLFNHTIIAAKDRQESAWFFTHMFGLPGPVEAGYFLGVELESIGHYAFLVSEDDFDGIYQRIQALKLDHWARSAPVEYRLPTPTTVGVGSTSSTRRDISRKRDHHASYGG